MYHVILDETKYCCVHVAEEPCLDVIQVFTGSGVESVILCNDCKMQALADTRPLWKPCNKELLARIVNKGCLEEFAGTPEIVYRPSSLAPVLSIDIGEPNIVTFTALDNSRWLLYTTQGHFEILEINSPSAAQRHLVAQAHLPEYPDNNPHRTSAGRPRLICDPTGRFAALVSDFGRGGIVVDLQTGKQTMSLDGGDYHFDGQEFSACFVEHRGRIVLIHRTDWNRLDASDPASGELLTPRTSIKHGEEHYLDYFHGALALTPDGRRILDTGWVWQPFGIPILFDAQAWLDGETWETEKRKDNPYAHDFVVLEDWFPGIWIDDNVFAIPQSIEPFHTVNMTNPSPQLPMTQRRPRGSMALLVSVNRPGEARPIAGAAGKFFSNAGQLFSADDRGLSVWDLSDGANVGVIPDFRPSVQNTASGELAQIHENELRIWSYL